MVDAVNISSGTSTVANSNQYSAAPQAVPTTTAVASVAKATASAATAPAAGTGIDLTQKAFIDPLSGVFVNEQLGNSGQVLAQNPQSITLAYLRDGLTAEGFPRQTVTA